MLEWMLFLKLLIILIFLNLKQINQRKSQLTKLKDREYYQKYLFKAKEVVLLVVNFDTKVG